MAEIDPYATTNALSRGFAFAQDAAQSRARRNAGNALSGGQPDLAAAALNEVGLLDEGQGVTNEVTRQQASAQALAEKERKEKLAWIGQGTASLLQIPAAERQQVYEASIRPTLQAMGFDEETLKALDSADKTDANLRALATAVGQEVEGVAANDRAGPNGSILRPDVNGAYAPAYTPPVDPLEQELMRARIEATRAQVGQREASAERARRPAAPRGGSRSPAASRTYSASEIEWH